MNIYNILNTLIIADIMEKSQDFAAVGLESNLNMKKSNWREDLATVILAQKEVI